MSRRIAIIQGHPDPRRKHFAHALASAYAQGATEAGHEVKEMIVAEREFPLLHTREEWESGSPPEVIRQAQHTIAWADHLVILYPL